MFWKNLSLFLAGVAFQVLAGVFPNLAGAFIGPASLLLSASDIRPVLNGSFFKHVLIFGIAVGCQACAVAFPAKWGAAGPLLAAGGILMNASDIKRVLKGPESPAHPIVTPDPEATPAKEPAKP